MKKISILFRFVFILFFVIGTASVFADNSTPSDNGPLQSILSGLELTGGISAGFFYASNPGNDTSDNEFLLSNFLVELSSADENFPLGFVGAFGETSTPSLFDTPETNNDFKIEYASLTFNPNTDTSLEVGLLQPNAGYENTYTFNNINVILGALASQQPYNAYGARLGYDVNSISLWAGYYKKRLDEEEYEINGSSPDNTWEIGLEGSVLDYRFSIYHYHINGLKNLTGAVLERTIKNVYLAFNIDYWNWDSGMKNIYESKSSIGGAVYLCPQFKHFSIPVRLEYIDQGESGIYSESLYAKRIYTATISPTYHFSENAYIRVESAYIAADKAFADKSGNSKNNRICLAAEVGYVF